MYRPVSLNKDLKREHFQLPILEDVLPELRDAKVFSTVDLSGAYLHCVLDEESIILTTVVTPYGRFAYKCLPY